MIFDVVIARHRESSSFHGENIVVSLLSTYDMEPVKILDSIGHSSGKGEMKREMFNPSGGVIKWTNISLLTNITHVQFHCSGCAKEQQLHIVGEVEFIREANV